MVKLIVCLLISAFGGTLLSGGSANGSGNEAVFEFRMPSVQPQTDDLTLCFARRIDSPRYIVGFKPLANMSINHHMIVYGCAEPENDQTLNTNSVWNCGEMNEKPSSSSSSGAAKYEKGSICFDGQPPTFVYAWAMGAPSFSLPSGVSYQIGTKSLRYLVLQQHYKNTAIFKPPSNAVDKGGVEFTTTSEPTPLLAGIFLLSSSDGVLQPKAVTNFEIACRMTEPNLILHPFAYRVHGHGNGLVTSGYRIRNGQWTEIGRQSPQLPQTFFNVTTPDIDIRQNDILAVRCTMYDKTDEPIFIGSTQYDEMCNFYIYYYTDANGVRPELAFCQNRGPPNYNWADFNDGNINLTALPKTVSDIPPAPPGLVPMDHGHGSNSQSQQDHSSMTSMAANDDMSMMYMGNDKIAREHIMTGGKVMHHALVDNDQQQQTLPETTTGTTTLRGTVDDGANNNNNNDIVNEASNSNEEEDDDSNNNGYYRSAYNYDNDPYTNERNEDFAIQQQQQQETAGFLAALG